jgi:hypothetical protein
LYSSASQSAGSAERILDSGVIRGNGQRFLVAASAISGSAPAPVRFMSW